jgi:tetratricopeptide (TPR) repeat protein
MGTIMADDLKRHEEAVELFKSEYAGRAHTLGEDHPRTLITMHHLGFSLDQLGRHTESLDVFFRAWEGRSRVLGEAHTSTLVTFCNVGWQYYNLERFEEAKRIASRGLVLATQSGNEDTISRFVGLRAELEKYFEDEEESASSIEQKRLLEKLRLRKEQASKGKGMTEAARPGGRRRQTKEESRRRRRRRGR